ncbi:MAG: glycosyltransferase family 2 protein [Bacteroidales bacterium]|nr:glycosyltransferase family 2 protein [Bacteroidales bacterium]
MKIFAIIVTYNGMRWYDRCLGSLRESELPVETIVVDNASNDGSVAYIKEHFPEVCLIESKENLGFAKANNIGIRQALDEGADYVFLLNQDAWVEGNTLTELVKTFTENKNVGIASPVHLNGHSSGLDSMFALYAGIDFTSDAYMRHLRPYYEVPFVNAAVWLVSRHCIETVGGFDTLLFSHYGEDANYCQRVHYHRMRILIATHCTACHDRETREAKTDKKEPLSDKYLPLEQRIELGDINLDYDINGKIAFLERQRLHKLLRGNLKGYRAKQREISDMRLIAQSRLANKAVGPTWL